MWITQKNDPKTFLLFYLTIKYIYTTFIQLAFVKHLSYLSDLKHLDRLRGLVPTERKSP